MKSIDDFIFLPKPRSLTAQPGSLSLNSNARILCQGDPAQLFPLARKLQEAVWNTQQIKWQLWSGRINNDDRVQAVVTLQPKGSIPVQGYRLEIKPNRIELTAAEAAGIFYGIMTLKQMLRQSPVVLPACRIDDHPDFPSRGVMVDISRDKVPTMATLYELVDQFAEWKFNHVELYTEHTFAYREHPSVWAEASPMTGEEILQLDAYCRERFVELVPNQNSFGHMQRWLALPEYRHLAECPDGYITPWGEKRSDPFSLDPANPGSLRLVEELYEDLLPHFTSKKFNVGGDETFDLGQGKSKELCKSLGKGRVYLDFLLKLYERVKGHDRTMTFWGDIIIQHPELVPELPKDVIAMEWGYEAEHPFDNHGGRFAQSGVPFFVCPGTSAWNSITGRTDNCLGNLRNAAVNGLKHGAIGFLITDWGDWGHYQYLPVSYPGYAAGAALSWCYQSNDDNDFVAVLNAHVFRDGASMMGKLACELGNVYQKTGHVFPNGSLFGHMLFNAEYQLPIEVTASRLEETKQFIDEVTTLSACAQMQREDAELILREFTNSARLLKHLCDRGLAIRNDTIKQPETKKTLADQMRFILGEHRNLWMARNRVGGLQDGVRHFNRLLAEYNSVDSPPV
jgi:hypothetical protein